MNFSEKMIDLLLVQKLAHLSRLGISEAEAEKFAGQLDGILEFFADLQNLKTEGISPVSQITGLENARRADVAKNFDREDNLLACSKNSVVDRHIVVPKAL